MKSHRRFREMVAMQGKLPPALAADLSLHLGQCERCRHLDAMYRAQASAMRSAYPGQRPSRAGASTITWLRANRALSFPPVPHKPRWRLRVGAGVAVLITMAALIPLGGVVADSVQQLFTVSTTAQNPCTVPGKRILRDRAYVISSPSQYAAAGGTIVPAMVAVVKNEPNVHYVVVYGDFSMTLDCRGGGTETDTQIGINQKDGTRLFAMSWQPLGGSVRTRPRYPKNFPRRPGVSSPGK